MINEQQVLETEDTIEDTCVDYMINRDLIKIYDIDIIDNTIFINKKHVISIMKRHLDLKNQKMYINVLSNSFTIPIRELLIIKQYYKNKYYISSVWTCIWFIVSMVLIGIIIYGYFK